MASWDGLSIGRFRSGFGFGLLIIDYWFLIVYEMDSLISPINVSPNMYLILNLFKVITDTFKVKIETFYKL